MSWIVTHQCRFQSRTHQQYCVNISKQTDTGQNIKQLTGSEHPFVTSEANGDDIFMPIRQQTGYLRVLDNSGGTLLEELMPENNTQKMVTLVNLTTGKTEWIGFLAAEVFTQPWGNELTELEFPLKSALSCLSDVTIDNSINGTRRIALLIYQAFTAMFQGDVPFTNIVLMDDFKNVCDELLIRANFNKFYRDEVIMNDNAESLVRIGDSFMDAIKALCQTFGLTLRQQGTSLIFGRYDDGTGFPVNVNVMGWDILATIANKDDEWPYDSLQPQGQIITRDLLPIADFRGSNNKLSFVPGGREAIVTLEVGSHALNILQLPESVISDSPVTDVYTTIEDTQIESTNVTFYYITKRIKVSMQNVARANTGKEAFNFAKRSTSATLIGNWAKRMRNHGEWSDSDITNFIKYSAFGDEAQKVIQDAQIDFPYLLTPYYSYDVPVVYTGAMACRWSTNGEILKNGIFLVQDVWSEPDQGDQSTRLCYTIVAPQSVRMENCYLHINMSVHLLNSMYLMKDAYGTQWDKANNNEVEYQFWCALRVNETGMFWNGSSWQNSWASFRINMKGTEVKSNKKDSMNIDEDNGWFIPINAEGTLVFDIFSTCFCNSGTMIKPYGLPEEIAYTYPFQKIITDLTIDTVYSRDITSSERGRNVYRKNILNMGFSEDKSIDLTFGTDNKNLPSPSLLRTYGNEGYIVDIGYIASDGSMVAERPEMHLLNRMVEYYKTMRRTMEAKIATGIDLFRNRFSYNGRKYMAIDKKHDWEREEQEVKFIEVT